MLSDEKGMYSEYQLAMARARAWDIGQRAKIDATGIAINLAEERKAFEELAEILGEKEFYDIVARSCCEKFERLFGYKFYLSDACVSNEIKEHVDAYEWTLGLRDEPNSLAAVYSFTHTVDEVKLATEEINIRISDIAPDNIQAIWFNYKDGLREDYFYSAQDPWAYIREIYPSS